MRTKRRSLAPASPRWLFALTLAGYPVAGLLASLFDWDSTLTSFPFRAGVVLLALFVLVRVPADRTDQLGHVPIVMRRCRPATQ